MRTHVLCALTAALLSCSPKLDLGGVEPDHSPDVPAWSAYNGDFLWEVAGSGESEAGCSLHFSFVGEPADIQCEDCEYAFVLDFTYEADDSVNDWDCVDEDTADFTWTLGYDADFYGYEIGAMWLYHEYGAYWTQAFYATLDGDELSFGYDAYTTAYSYDYYRYSYEGTGTVE